MKNIPLIIKELRLKNNFSQEQIAAFIGDNCKREMISYYETGEREVPLIVLEKLSDLFGIELEDFFEDDPDEIKTTCAFAYRAEGLEDSDFEKLALFRKIVKNYNKMLKLESNDAK